MQHQGVTLARTLPDWQVRKALLERWEAEHRVEREAAEAAKKAAKKTRGRKGR